MSLFLLLSPAFSASHEEEWVVTVEGGGGVKQEEGNCFFLKIWYMHGRICPRGESVISHDFPLICSFQMAFPVSRDPLSQLQKGQLSKLFQRSAGGDTSSSHIKKASYIGIQTGKVLEISLSPVKILGIFGGRVWGLSSVKMWGHIDHLLKHPFSHGKLISHLEISFITRRLPDPTWRLATLPHAPLSSFPYLAGLCARRHERFEWKFDKGRNSELCEWGCR